MRAGSNARRQQCAPRVAGVVRVGRGGARRHFLVSFWVLYKSNILHAGFPKGLCDMPVTCRCFKTWALLQRCSGRRCFRAVTTRLIPSVHGSVGILVIYRPTDQHQHTRRTHVYSVHSRMLFNSFCPAGVPGLVREAINQLATGSDGATDYIQTHWTLTGWSDGALVSAGFLKVTAPQCVEIDLLLKRGAINIAMVDFMKYVVKASSHTELHISCSKREQPEFERIGFKTAANQLIDCVRSREQWCRLVCDCSDANIERVSASIFSSSSNYPRPVALVLADTAAECPVDVPKAGILIGLWHSIDTWHFLTYTDAVVDMMQIAIKRPPHYDVHVSYPDEDGRHEHASGKELLRISPSKAAAREEKPHEFGDEWRRRSWYVVASPPSDTWDSQLELLPTQPTAAVAPATASPAADQAVQSAPTKRKKLLEIFSGTGRISKEFKEAFDYIVHLVDSNLQATEWSEYDMLLNTDLSTLDQGLFEGVWYDLVWIAFPCTSFSALTNPNPHGRTKELPLGTSPAAHKANQLFSRIVHELLPTLRKTNPNLIIVLENPATSFIRYLPDMEMLTSDLGCLPSNVTYCSFGDMQRKELTLWSNSPMLQDVLRDKRFVCGPNNRCRFYNQHELVRGASGGGANESGAYPQRACMFWAAILDKDVRMAEHSPSLALPLPIPVPAALAASDATPQPAGPPSEISSTPSETLDVGSVLFGAPRARGVPSNIDFELGIVISQGEPNSGHVRVLWRGLLMEYAHDPETILETYRATGLETPTRAIAGATADLLRLCKKVGAANLSKDAPKPRVGSFNLMANVWSVTASADEKAWKLFTKAAAEELAEVGWGLLHSGRQRKRPVSSR